LVNPGAMGLGDAETSHRRNRVPKYVPNSAILTHLGTYQPT
jgi:hypothetical protein